MTTVGLLVLLEAKPENAQELGDLLTGALPLARAERGTTAWFAFRLGPSSFGIFDAFGSDEDRRAHLEGEIATALVDAAPLLLAGKPDIRPVDVLADKLPTGS